MLLKQFLKYKNTIVGYLISISFVSILFASQLAFFKTLAIVTLIIASLFQVNRFFKNEKHFTFSFYTWGSLSALLILSVILVVEYYNTGRHQSEILVGGFSLLFFANILIFKNKKEIPDFFLNVLLIAGFFVLLFYSYKLILLQSVSFFEINKIDNNYLALNLLFVLIAILWRIHQFKKKWVLLFLNVFFLLVVILIVLTGSRRGLVGLFFLIGLGGLFFFKYREFYKLIYAIFFGLFIMFLFGMVAIPKDSSFRTYIIEHYFNDPHKVKNEITSTVFKYKKAINSSTDYSDVYDGLWTEFGSTGVIENVLSSRIKNQIKSKSNISEYEEIIPLLKEYRILDTSAVSLKQILPKILKYTPDSLISNKYIEKLPYCINIPYQFKYFTKLVSYYNLIPIGLNNNNGDIFIEFKRTKVDSAYFFTFAPGHSAYYELTFKIKKNLSIPKLFIKAANGSDILYNVQKYTVLNGVDYKSVKINYTLVQKSKFVRLIFVFKPGKANIQIGGIKLCNIKPYNSVLGELCCNSKKDLRRSMSLFSSEVEYKRRFENHIKRFEISERVPLYAKKNELKNFLDFKVYNEYSEDSISNGQTYLYNFKRGKKYFKFKLPAINSSVLKIHFKTNTKKIGGVFYRYPNKGPEYLKAKLQQLSIINNKNGFWTHNYKCTVDSCANGVGQFAIFPSLSYKDTIVVKDINFEFGNLMSSIDSINIMNYTLLSKIVKGHRNKNELDTIQLQKKELLNKYNIEKIETSFIDSRLARWIVSYRIFKKYSIWKKIIGNGMSYTEIFPIIFYKGHKLAKYDYPHNPIISAFLYSGILGGLLYIYFLFIVFWRYWKLRKELGLFAILYILTFAFTFFSGNSHFSVPAFAFLSLIPFVFDISSKNIVE